MISMDKKYRTRDGRDVRLLCVDGPKLWPVVGIVDGDSHVSCWTLSGKLFNDAEDYRTDLVERHEIELIGAPHPDTTTLTRRDHFAMAAMTGVMGSGDISLKTTLTDEESRRRVSEFSYKIADAMEAARNKEGAE